MSISQSLMTAEQMFHDFLESNGHPLDKEVNYDSSKFHYFECPHGCSTDARYKFYSDGIQSGYLKCWHCGIEADFCSKQKYDVSLQEWQAHRKRLAKIKQQNEEEEQQRYAKIAVLAKALFDRADEEQADRHGYLLLKKVKNHGLRVVTHEDENTEQAKCYKGTLLAPCYNKDDKLVSLERIYFDKNKNKYQKRPLSDGQRSGVYCLIGEINNPHNIILLAEGVSTAFTVYEATGYPTAITFSCYNLVNVAKILREKYPETKLIIIADDDKWQSAPKLRDSGLKAAKKACANVDYATYLLPDFEALKLPNEKLKELELTDMNDLFVHLLSRELDETSALSIIQQQILKGSVLKPMPHSAILNHLIEKVTEVNFVQLAELKEGETLKNSQIQVIAIDQILRLAKNNNWGLCKQYDFLYLFNGEYWGLLEKMN